LNTDAPVRAELRPLGRARFHRSRETTLTARVVLTAEEIRRAVRRIAHEIVERNPDLGDLIFVGVRTRGVPLAHRLSAAIAQFEGFAVPVGAIDIGLYRDDIHSLELRPRIQPSELPTDLEGRTVVIVDDVLFTGRSVRAALDAITDFGRAAQVQLAVLVDRGHRQLPIRADYAGKNIPTSLLEEVDVLLEETDGHDEVRIVRTEGER
jgi:pyrimidine operon attenuation protein/uracil phosphoribosyltransferase